MKEWVSYAACLSRQCLPTLQEMDSISHILVLVFNVKWGLVVAERKDIKTHILSSWREILQHYGHHPLTGKCTLSNSFLTICSHTLYLLVYTQIGYLCSLQKFQGLFIPSFSLASSSAWQLQRVVFSFHSAFPSHLIANLVLNSHACSCFLEPGLNPETDWH
jgi:hypothetical protein